jgi:signal transduction histidine kinase
MREGGIVHRILVADDERLVLEAYRTVLTSLNPESANRGAIERLEAELFGQPGHAETMPVFDPVLCRRGEDAVEAVRAARQHGPEFPVAFLDVRMPPGIDGIETASRIRALDPDINIVIVTAYADKHPRDIALHVPPLDKLFYISKPFQAMELQQFALALSSKWKVERELRHATQEVSLRCLDLEAAQAELVEARRRAELASRAKSEFLANMSHELRTPLNAVIGFADVIRNESFGPIGNERYREYLDDINHSGMHLLRVINDLLDFSKIEAGKLDLEVEEVDLDELLDGTVGIMRKQAEGAGVDLRRERSVQEISLLADAHRVRQVLLNLLSNAIKFTRKQGRVTVSAAIDGAGTLSISVADTGIGMTVEDIALALEPFGQIDGGLARKYQGTGLGLPIAKRLAEMQGGVLTLSSQPGRGTVATIKFPANRHWKRPQLRAAASS